MGPDEDLPTLIQRNDHLNVLRYARAHQLRDPDLVLKHGKALLGENVDKKIGDELARLAALEQMCLSALDAQDHPFAQKCLGKLKEAVGKEPVRFRALLGRCLESTRDDDAAKQIYMDLLEDNPSNLVALKRMYCLATTDKEKMDKLNNYLEQNRADPAGWYEMAQLRLSMADYRGAAYALEEVVMGSPLDSDVHCLLGEVYATIGGVENLQLARKHMAQSLELNSSSRRALFGLVAVANDFLEAVASKSKKSQSVDDHDVEVAKELVKYGADKILKSYKGTKMYGMVQKVVEGYTEGL